jgi:hypothetical protein
MILGALLLLAAAPEVDFNAYWHDGKAELDGYHLTAQRYANPRAGRAVLIYVTEPFSATKHTKIEDASKLPADALDVLKLNLVRQFQTGIYDYDTILSLFVKSDDLSPLKSAFSASEWCGQVYEELNVRDGRLDQKFFSYFENESSAGVQDIPAGGVFEDELFILLRGLHGEFLRPGEKRTVPLLESAYYRRLAHRKSGWASAVIERAPEVETVRVPAGSFATFSYIIKPADGRVGRFSIEQAYPHKIVRWSWTPASNAAPFLGGTDAGELTGSARLEYWKLHDPGDESNLQKLGLSVRGP